MSCPDCNVKLLAANDARIAAYHEMFGELTKLTKKMQDLARSTHDLTMDSVQYASRCQTFSEFNMFVLDVSTRGQYMSEDEAGGDLSRLVTKFQATLTECVRAEGCRKLCQMNDGHEK